MKFKNYLFLCLVALLATTACKKNGTPKPGTKIDTDVYVAGTLNAGGKPSVAYWMNGQMTKLSHDETVAYTVTGMAVYGGIVYVCGYYQYSDASNVTHKIAVYWVSTATAAPVEHLLTAEAVANGITADANGVYIAGIINENATDLTKYHAALWIDDRTNVTVTNLTPTIHNSKAYGVTINGGSIYVAGEVGGGVDPTYWVDVNNTITPTPLDKTGVSNGAAKAVLFNGTDMYVVGQTTSTSTAASYWLNNHAPVRLTDQSAANCIAVNSKGDIYVGGTNYDNDSGNTLGASWKNSDITSYGNESIGAINAMTLVGDDLYMAGGYYSTTGVGDSFQGYWKNGVFKPITDANEVKAMVVLTHPH